MWKGLLAVCIWVMASSGPSALAETAGLQTPPFEQDGVSFWTLVSLQGGPRDPDAILQFEGASLTLDIPCYRRSWAFRYEAGVMTFSNPYQSESRCGSGIPPIVGAFDWTIVKVKTAHADGQLTLRDADGRPLLALQRLTATGLENRKWFIAAFFDGRSLVTTREKFAYPLLPYITFMHRSLIGSPGCGGFVGFYSLLDGHVTIHAGSILRGLCPEGEFELGVAVDAALSGVRTLQKSGDSLLLLDPQGRTQIVLVPWEKREP